MCNMTGFDVVTETETGIVYSISDGAVYVHKERVDDIETAASNASMLHADTPDGAVRLPSIPNTQRSPATRAELLAVLIDRVGYFDASVGDVSVKSPHSACVPVQVARDGTAAIACYLAVNGLDNGEIADLLDVGSRTVSQYLSDFRKGDR